jgi:hypothetical protein
LEPFVAAEPFQASLAKRRFRILAVDDHADTLALIVRALQTEDQYVVSNATSGAEALRMIGEQIPDLVVLDYKMSGMDGPASGRPSCRPGDASAAGLMAPPLADEPSTRGFERARRTT